MILWVLRVNYHQLLRVLRANGYLLGKLWSFNGIVMANGWFMMVGVVTSTDVENIIVIGR